MQFGTKAKTTPSGLPAAGWWRRVVATLIDDTLTLLVIWIFGLFGSLVVGKIIWTALTKTIAEVQAKLAEVGSGIVQDLQGKDPGNIQQQIHDLIAAWRASEKTPDDLGTLLAQTYIHNLHVSFLQALILILCLVGSIYFVIYNHILRIHRTGRSFGDGLVGIYTVTDTAFFPSYRKATIRYLALGFIASVVSAVGSASSFLANVTNSLVGLLWLTDLLYPVFDKNARSLHDRISGTYPAHPDRFGYALEHMSTTHTPQ